jgi:hypothetical protein
MSCRTGLESCSTNTCFESAPCASPFYNEIKCNCSVIPTNLKLGSRCQWQKRTFSPKGTFQFYPLGQPPASCFGWHISLQYLSRKDKAPQNCILFYAGPSTVTQNNIPILAVQLTNGEPELVVGTYALPIPIGNPLQDEIKWHRIDLFVNSSTVTMIQNLCSFSLHQENSNPKCLVQAPIDENLLANSQTQFYLGGRPDIGLTLMHSNSFTGCIKNVQINNRVNTLFSSTTSDQSSNDCDVETNSCGPVGCGLGSCEGPQDNQSRGQCICDPGFMKRAGDQRCSVATDSFQLTGNSGAQWILQDAKHWEDQRAPNGRSILPVQFRFRTATTNAVLINLVGWTDEGINPPRQVFITIGVNNGILSSSYRLTNPNVLLELNVSSTVNASDGRWHNVQYVRSGPTVSLKLDQGEAQNYALSYNANVSSLSKINNITQVNVGSLAFDGAQATNLTQAQKNVFSGCMDDIRLFQNNYKLSDSNVKATQDLVSPNIKPCGDLCKTVRCAAKQECIDLWPEGRCRPIFNCNSIQPNPCLNGGSCSWNAASVAYICTCARGFIGESCETETAFAFLQWWWILLAILLFLILLLIVSCIYYFCCTAVGGAAKKESAVTSKELELPPEKVANSNTQGAGEVDFQGPIDFSWFQPNRVAIPDGNLPYIPPEAPEKVDPGFDYPLEYAYEGRGASPIPSISSIVGTDYMNHGDDEPLDLPHMSDWGPQFQTISDIYNGNNSKTPAPRG